MQVQEGEHGEHSDHRKPVHLHETGRLCVSHDRFAGPIGTVEDELASSKLLDDDCENELQGIDVKKHNEQ